MLHPFRRPRQAPRGRLHLAQPILRGGILLAIWAVTIPHRARAADPPPIDRLLRLAPPDAACVVTVENLREQARRFTGSRLAAALWRLPTARAWLNSDQHTRFDQAREQIETILNTPIESIRDDLLGDAAALALRVPEQGASPQGVLLVKARDRALLERLIERINHAQKEAGDLENAIERRRGEIVYHGRVYPAGAGRPTDWYVTTSDGVFALSSEEALITGVIDRWLAIAGAKKAPDGEEVGTPGFGDSPRLAAIRRRMPATALARLYLDPRRLERLIPAQPATPADNRLLALATRSLAAVEYVGAALTWEDAAIAVRLVENFDPAKVAPWVKRWASDPRPSNPRVDRTPPGSIAVASVHFDLKALRDGLDHVLAPTERSAVENVETVLTGLLLGQDFRARVLPRLGPRVVAFALAPEIPKASEVSRKGFEFPAALMVSLNEAGGSEAGAVAAANRDSIGAAVENALKTVLALAALDEKRGLAGARIQSDLAAGARMVGFDAPALFTFAIDQGGGRVIVGSSRPVVAQCLEAGADSGAGERFRRLASAATNGEVPSRSPSYVVIDVQAAARALASRRQDVARAIAARGGRTAEAVDRDLEHVLALARELDSAVLTHSIEPDASSAVQTLRVSLSTTSGSAGP